MAVESPTRAKPAVVVVELNRAWTGFCWKATTLIAAVFFLCVSAILVWQQHRHSTHDPLKAAHLATLKQELARTRQNEQLQEEIRRVDLSVRRDFFTELFLSRTGAWLLLGAAAVFLVGMRQAISSEESASLPDRRVPVTASDGASLDQISRRSVIIAGLVIGVGLLAVGFGIRTSLSRPGSDAESAATNRPEEDLPSRVQLEANWPRFLGFNGSGMFKRSGAGDEESLGSDLILLWKSPVPRAGLGSPVIWGDKIFLDGADMGRREVFCFSASTGDLLWRRSVTNVLGSPATTPKISDLGSYAASTMATDGRRVFAIFANGDLAAFRFDGTPLWTRHVGITQNQYGHASSPVAWDGKLFVQVDQGESAPAGSALYALDTATGRELWRRARPVPASWATPVILEVKGKPQIVTAGNPWIIGYTLSDGAEIWRAECLANEVTPSPIGVKGLALVTSPNERLLALRVDGQGDVTKTHIEWATEENVPDIASPASNGELVFTLTASGLVTCLETGTGKKVWEQQLDGEFHASPAIWGQCLYLVGRKGSLFIVSAGRVSQQRNRFELGEAVSASPALTRDRIFIRGERTLFCLGTAPAKQTSKL